jgi:LPXTG-motif cell wall-anchored protein
MAVSEVVVCEAYGLAEAGQYANTGSVVGTPPVTIGSSGGTDVRVQPDETDDNPDHYYGVVLDVEIVKTTQTIDIDSADTPFVPVGDDVAWEYTVTNTGNYELVNVTVTDDQLADADIDCGGGSNVIASLGVSLSATCTAAGTATAGAYANIGSVIGTGPATVDTDGEAVGADTTDESDASAYFGSAPAIDIEKWVNGEDADTQPGVITSPGEALTWEYIVTNTGNVELTDVTVLDDQGVSVDCGEATGNVIATLAVDETVTCTGSGNAPDLGAYTNVGSVTGTAPDTVDTAGASVPGVEVSDEDAANVFTAVPELDIVKYVVTDIDDDANVAPGPSLNRYSLASWKIVVSNTGNVALFDVTVVDPALGLEGAELLCDGGTNVVAMLLPGGSFTCTALTVVTDLGLFTNTATATAQPEYDLDPVGDADAANYTGVVSGGYGDILPATGSGTPLPFGTIASLLMAAGAALVLLTRRRRHTTA